MSHIDTFKVNPLVVIIGSKKSGLAVRSPKLLTLQISNGRLVIFEGTREIDKFFLKKLLVKFHPEENEYHLRTDGFAMKLATNDMSILEIIDSRISEARNKSAPQAHSGTTSQFRAPTQSVTSRYSSPPLVHHKSSGLVSRVNVGGNSIPLQKNEKNDNRFQSPVKSIDKKVYTQSPLKSPLKSLNPLSSIDDTSVETSIRSTNNNLPSSLDQLFPSSLTSRPLTSIPQKTYGRKRPISGALSTDNNHSVGLFDIVKVAEQDDFFSENISDIHVLPKDTKVGERVSVIETSEFASTPIKSDTKKILPKQQNLYKSIQSKPSPSTTIGITSSPLTSLPTWDKFSSLLNPNTTNDNSANYKQARMRISSPTTYSLTAKNDSNEDGMRTPELPSGKRSALFAPPLFASASGTWSSGMSHTANSYDNILNRDLPFQPATLAFEGKFEGGIRNLGNTCYMSAVLQALSSVRGLHHNLHNPLWSAIYSQISHPPTQTENIVENESAIELDTAHFQSPLATYTSMADYCSHAQKPYFPPEKSVALQLSNMLRLLEAKRSRPVNPSDLQELVGNDNTNRMMGMLLKVERKVSVDPMKFRSCIIQKQEKYADFGQQDAQEFLTDLLNELEEDMWKIIRNFWMYAKKSTFIARKQKEMTTILPITTPSPASISTVPNTVSVSSHPSEESAGTEEQQTQPQQLSEVNAIPHIVSKEPLAMDNTVRYELDPVTEEYIRCEIDNHMQHVKALLPSSLFFDSMMQSIMTCVHCGFSHEPRVETYRDFSLDIMSAQEGENFTRNSQELPPSQIHLNELICGYLQPEYRDLRCPRCEVGQKVRMQKQLTTLAPVLVFHLKRFRYDRNFQQFRKIDSSVKFPARLSLRSAGMIDNNTLWSKLEVKTQLMYSMAFKKIFESKKDVSSPSVIEERLESIEQLAKEIQEGRPARGMMAFAQQEDSEYVLTAVVRHYGLSMGSGHYICDVKNNKQQQHHNLDQSESSWLRYNDATVTSIDEYSVLGEMDTPYLLFYQRVESK